MCSLEKKKKKIDLHEKYNNTITHMIIFLYGIILLVENTIILYHIKISSDITVSSFVMQPLNALAFSI